MKEEERALVVNVVEGGWVERKTKRSAKVSPPFINGCTLTHTRTHTNTSTHNNDKEIRRGDGKKEKKEKRRRRSF
jgi:hypothetical protein